MSSPPKYELADSIEIQQNSSAVRYRSIVQKKHSISTLPNRENQSALEHKLS